MVDDDGRYAPRLHPDDLAALKEAWNAGPAPAPPSKPPVFAKGEDAAVWQDMLRRELEKHEDSMLRHCREQLDELFADLEMPVRTHEERIRTRKKLASLWAIEQAASTWKQEFFGTLWKSFAAWVAGLVTAGLAYLWTTGGRH